MARIQILELPTEHHGDDMTTPFILVIDQTGPELPDANGFINSGWKRLKDETGARCVFMTTDTIEIPANTVTLDDGQVVRTKVEPDLSGFSAAIEAAIEAANRRLSETLRAGRRPT